MGNILIIAGSDSSAGAGIQADIKTANHFSTDYQTVITSITAQSDKKVFDIFYSSKSILEKQLSASFSSTKPDAIKIGMLGNKKIVKKIAKFLQNYKIPIILDPIISASSGKNLITKNGLELLKKSLLKEVFLLTPNIPEAEILSGLKIKTDEDLLEAGKKIIKKYKAKNVLIKGGHKNNVKTIKDFLCTEKEFFAFEKKYLNTSIRGSGCYLATAITCLIANGKNLHEAIKEAGDYVYTMIKNTKLHEKK